MLVIFIICLVFVTARSKLFAVEVAAEAQREREEAEQRELELREQNERIEQQNKQIQDQLLLTQLNSEQVAIVEANSMELDEHVRAAFQLNWRDLLFEARLGSGSFGDCYRGRCVCIFLCRALERRATLNNVYEISLYAADIANTTLV